MSENTEVKNDIEEEEKLKIATNDETKVDQTNTSNPESNDNETLKSQFDFQN